ncbi:hypothetical protein QQF64_005255 [Cirrhinus molitorella]|uniref:Uncharacterized protein n=1 Tax=Cirrhinus molitorella TaxID=172907 RepID=A0ABR3MIR8_9TELE
MRAADSAACVIRILLCFISLPLSVSLEDGVMSGDHRISLQNFSETLSEEVLSSQQEMAALSVRVSVCALLV